ncbi:MAG TPA: lysylphosphatidylglycerol synthase domain-containing protein [Thermoanaerobaculia bacterium]|nr:lysylphosphatidylglycerol synthase domain-containing protein [Thermoanaerobaculia bacterium]
MEPRESRRDIVGSYIFSYLLGAAILVLLVYLAGPWQFFADTRILATFIEGGMVQYHDVQKGFFSGMPDLKLYAIAKEPVSWLLIQMAGLIFLGFWMIHAVIFHLIARFCRIEGTFTMHARAYLEGIGINRFLPFNRGHHQIAEAIRRQGVSNERVSQALFLDNLVIVFQIVAFALIGLYLSGWSLWLTQLTWPLIILGACWLMVRPNRNYPERYVFQGGFSDAVRAVKAFAQKPLVMVAVALLALVAIALEDVIAYMISNAFSTPMVIMSVTYSSVLMAIVGGYIARLIPVTPGGIGQFEAGFATALYFSGVNFEHCVALAVLDQALRYTYGTFLLAWVYILRVDYSWEVLKRFGKAPTPAS